ncbi:MAG: YjbQ family protein [Candidatus Altiarchaeota archaeon]|nr:YjbQ family protein [Candidatus Altiarchaeota archaeon]
MEINFTTKKGQVLDLTDKLSEIVKRTGVTGLINVFAPHATGILMLGEHEPHIAQDYLKVMDQLVPQETKWDHDKIDNNAAAHLRSALFGASTTIPVIDGKLQLGTWQRILFVEVEGDRHRRVMLTWISSK